MQDTQTFFIVSSGRSGTHALAEALELYESVDMHHEYQIAYTQPLAFKYYMRLINFDSVVETLQGTYGSAVALSDKPLWGDSSNKASWLIRPLLKVFPNAKFIWLVRDGRKVVSSFYHKLANECYDDKSVKIIRSWLELPEASTQPPPEKKYWWPLPPCYYYGELPERFRLICWHWNEINRFVGEQLYWVDLDHQHFVRLEDLVSKRTELENLLDFLDLPWCDDVWDMLQIPGNVGVPEDFSLSPEQLETFRNECQSMMERFMYDGSEYTMTYEHQPQNWKAT